MTREIAVVGGGPAGLYVARLLKILDRNLDVTVYERLDGAAQTFGFGVGLTESTMRNLGWADPRTAEEVRQASYMGHELHLKGGGRSVTLHGARNLAIGRAALLEIFGKAAAEAGVEIRRGTNADVSSIDADVIVAADGVASVTRQKYASELGVCSRQGRTRFVWCGADFAADSSYFTAVRSGESLFVAHVYPYAADRSTVLIEVDDLTWDTAGLAELDGRARPDGTDYASVSLLEREFANELSRRPLLTNRTRWSRFVDLSLERWSVDNVVFVGDAAHTAHYTLGSGTKLALEDAITLAEALTGAASTGEAFAQYESLRRPAVERFKKLARRSQAWWDSFRLRRNWPLDRLALSYMTRSGNLMLEHYAADQPDVTRRALAVLGAGGASQRDDLNEWVLATPVSQAGIELPRRSLDRSSLEALTPVQEVEWAEPDVWGEAADGLVEHLTQTSNLPILVTGPSVPDDLAMRIDFAERLRLVQDRLVGVRLPGGERSMAATAVAAGRADFVVMG